MAPSDVSRRSHWIDLHSRHRSYVSERFWLQSGNVRLARHKCRVIAIGGVRIATVSEEIQHGPIYGVSTAAIVAYVEISLAIFCACGPWFSAFCRAGGEVANATRLSQRFSISPTLQSLRFPQS